MSEEIWKPVVGYEGLYEVSNLGNIKSINKIHLKKITNRADGYTSVRFYDKSFLTHRIVARAFIPNPDNKPQVNHKNGIKNDNRVENLEWCTISENQKHSHSVLGNKNNFQMNHPTRGMLGKRHYLSKKVIQYNIYGTFIKVWDSISDANRETLIPTSSISRCCLGKKSFKTAGGFIWKYYFPDNLDIHPTTGR